jgi:exocyst complex component 2
MRDGQSMMTNIFEIIQTMINYTFFLNQEEEEEEDLEEEDEDPVVEKVPLKKDITVPKLKELNSFVATNDNEDFDADAVWQAFQNVTGTLERLPSKDYGINFKAHPVMIVHFATQIMDSFQACYDEIKPCYTGDEGSAVLESFAATVDTVKERLVTSICDGWVETSTTFFHFEDWTFENQSFSPGKEQFDSTTLLKLANKYSKFLLRSLALVISNEEEIVDDKDAPNAVHIEKVRIALFESLFGFLDGFQWQLSQWRDPESSKNISSVPGWVPEIHHTKLKSILPDQKSKFGQFAATECANFVEMMKPKDYKKLDDRHLMILCNLMYLRNGILQNLTQIFESKFHVDIGRDTQFFAETSDLLERIVVLNFAKRQCAMIKQLIKTAFLFSGLDWASLNKPHEIRPYCYHILHHLVYVHASISAISKPLVPVVMSEIVMFLAQEILMAVRQVDRYNISGMLQVLYNNVGNPRSRIFGFIIKEL